MELAASRSVPLKRFIRRLIWACVLPLVVLGGALAVDSVLRMREASEAQAQGAATNAAQYIDQTLRSRIQALSMLAASSHALDARDLPALYREAQAFREQFNSHVLIVDAESRVLANTRLALGAPTHPLPKPKGRAAMPEALRTGKPAVGDLFPGPVARVPLVAIAVPAMRDGATRLVLIGTFDARFFAERLVALDAPEGWMVSLLDSTGQAIARRPGAEFAPSVPQRRFVAPLAEAPWSIAVDVPEVAHNRSLVVTTVGLAAALLLATLAGVAGGYFASRRLGRAVAALSQRGAAPAPRRDIQEIAEARSALQESDQRFRSAFEAAPLGMALVSPEGTILQANPQFCAIFGYRAGEMAGLHVRDVNTEEDARKSIQMIRDLVEGRGGRYEREKQMRRKDGSLFWAHVTSSAVRDAGGTCTHFITMVQDIQARKDAEAAVRESEERYRAFVEQSIAGVYILQDGRIVYANPRLREIFGYKPDEALDPDPLAHAAPFEHDMLRARMQERLTGEPTARYVLTAVRKDGSRFPLGVHATRATLGGRPAIFSIAQEVTDSALAQERAQEMLERLERAMRSTIEVVAKMGALRDPFTRDQGRRVCDLAVALARELDLPADQVEGVRVAAFLHDIGNVAVPAEILAMPRRLTREEFALIQEHPLHGHELLKGLDFPWPVAEVALQHHERMDGSGYPRGLKGAEILLEARILAVADTVEAMASHRPYRPALGLDTALEEIENGRGRLYDARVVEACTRLFRERGFRLPD